MSDQQTNSGHESEDRLSATTPASEQHDAEPFAAHFKPDEQPVYYGPHPKEEAERVQARRHRRRVIITTVVCVIVALAAVVGITGFLFYRSARVVAQQAQDVVTEADEFQSALMSGDSGSLQSSAASIASTTSSMWQETESPVWNAVEILPVVGEDVSRVRTLASVAQDLSSNALTPLASSMAGISMGTLFANGQINVSELSQLCSAIEQVQPAISDAAERVDSLGTANLAQVNEPLQKVRDELDGLNSAAEGLSKVAPSLPSMLGANGTRNYLVVAQNNAEIRPTGGFPGSRMLLTIQNGTISLTDFQPIGQWFNNSSIPVTDEEGYVAGDLMATAIRKTPGDVNAVPSFPRAAQLMEWCWVNQGNPQVDGVIAADPVFLQSLLKLTGGITASDGTVVDGTNAAQILMNQVYYLPVDEQDPFFNNVASLAVHKLMDSLGSLSLTDLASTVGDGIADGRVLLYMNNADEESSITTLGADGEVSHDSTNPVTGVYLFDNTWSKIDWYLDFKTSVGQPQLNQDGSKSYPVTVTLHNTTTNELMEQLPAYITGGAPADTHAMRTSFILMAPAGGSITNVSVDADELPTLQEASLYGNDVWAGIVYIYPANTATFTYTVTTSSDATSALTVHATPTAQTFE